MIQFKKKLFFTYFLYVLTKKLIMLNCMLSEIIEFLFETFFYIINSLIEISINLRTHVFLCISKLLNIYFIF